MALLPTCKLAEKLSVKPESIIAHYCRRKSYFGVIPEKLPNGRLLWPADSLERMKAHKEG